ncbi:hypothetical protein [Phormidesmis priestleyi]
MDLLTHNTINHHQWQAYKKLELISESVDNADINRDPFRFGIDQAWRLLITLLLDELVTEQKTEYLDRCWALTDLEEGTRSLRVTRKRSPSKTLQRLLILMS